MEEKIIEWNGRLLTAVPQAVNCGVCALRGKRCAEAQKLVGSPCYEKASGNYVFKETSAEVVVSPEPSLGELVERFSGVDIPEVSGRVDKRAEEGMKLSCSPNPKDLVGIRKAPMSTVSAAVMAEVGVAMHEGALKYGRHNYRAVGVRSSVYYDGTMRHLMAWWEGEDIDPDSELSHITKAITSLVVLRDAMLQGKCTDDRPPRSAPFYAELNKRAAALIDKHADKNPRHYTIADTEEIRHG
jgi:hypothetical protein